jgi:voltage-gated sodium channel
VVTVRRRASRAEAVTPFAAVFFVSYVLLAAFIVFNLLIGIVIGSMEKARQDEAEDSGPDAAQADDAAPSDEALLGRISQLRGALDELERELAARTR